jgi:predicted alpha/beta-hydrolase family hydrolase
MTAARLILAHGAGAGQKHPWIQAVKQGLEARGLEVVTFDFPYMKAGRKLPDKAPILEAAWREEIEKHRAQRLFLGGKSMGGRIASMVAAASIDGVEGLVFLGYPLHPPKQPDKRRDAHLPEIRERTLFVQGERDPFGTPKELRPVLQKMKNATLYPVKGDHSFPVTDEILDRIAEWILSESGLSERGLSERGDTRRRRR